MEEGSYWDVTPVIRDLSLDIVRHTSEGATPDKDELTRWLQWLNQTARAYHALGHACEDLVEFDASEARQRIKARM